ncbi:hypothetical protein QFZ73_005682 [Peribacillus sp. V2I11]|nr:hypothetical protein [Peribacillus sp. V2I11]
MISYLDGHGVLPTKRGKHTLREIQDKKSLFSYAKGVTSGKYRFTTVRKSKYKKA